jgi:hypothetical protein
MVAKGVVIKKVVRGQNIPVWMNLTTSDFGWSNTRAFATRLPKSLAEKFVKFLNHLTENLESSGNTPSRDLLFSVELEPEPDRQSINLIFEKVDSEIRYSDQNKEKTREYYEGQKLVYVRSKRWIYPQCYCLLIQPEKIRWNDLYSYKTLIPQDLADELVIFLNEYIENIRQDELSSGGEIWDSLKELNFFTVEED